MLTKLALQNIREKKFRTFLASLSIAIGTASLIVFLGLSSGIKSATFEEIEKKSPLTQITVRPKTDDTGVVAFLTRSEEGKLSQESINEISKINGVKKIHPEIQFNNFASLEVSLLGMSLVTDTMVFGVPEEFIQGDLQSPEIWRKSEEPYPALIPRKILDLYNLTVATPQNLPLMSEESLLGKELILYPNYSTFFPISNDRSKKVKLEVVGFSDKVNLIGVTLSDEIVLELNKKYTDNESGKFLELFVETQDALSTPAIANQIEAMGYNTAYYQKNLKDVEAKFAYLRSSLGIISLIILLTAAIAIISTFLATVAERTKEIGLFRALGATKSHIKRLILIEAGIVGLIGSTIGVILGLLGSKIIDSIGLNQLSQTTFRPDTLFVISPKLIVLTMIFGTLLSVLSAYLPATKAANISPIKALKRL
ncbi:MAG: FtsX-like permease family protein [bacterium]|nr:FtsX-like permease family protein [bacterium]